MTTITHAPTSPPVAAVPTLDLDARLALADAAMTVRLDHAQLAFAVNTAHLPDTAAEVPIAPIRPEPASTPPASPLAACLTRAAHILQERGWVRGGLRDNNGAVCAIGAIRAATHPNRDLADDACVLLLDVIQRHHPNAETVPSWNDAQTHAGSVASMLRAAANTA
ncbi:DUF6197 family protein [Streptomyces sp. NPDC055025]